jgi:adenine deaminase
LGAISPGYLADLLIFDSLTDIRARSVYKTGQLIAIDGEIVVPSANLACQTPINSVNMPLLSADSFSIAARGRLARVIGLGRNQLYTEERHLPPRITADQVSSDTAQDILKIAVIDRHTGTAKRGLGLVQGFGLKRGAMAASIAHDSHNIIAVAADDESLAAVVNQVAAMQGGIAVVDQDRILASLSLPIAGLMSSAPITTVSAQMNDLKRATHELGGSLEDPFMAMSFLALPVIPQLKITDQGLVDVSQFSLVDLFISE